MPAHHVFGSDVTLGNLTVPFDRVASPYHRDRTVAVFTCVVSARQTRSAVIGNHASRERLIFASRSDLKIGSVVMGKPKAMGHDRLLAIFG